MKADDPYWHVPTPSHTTLDRHEAEVVIVGAGIAGLLIATALRGRGHDVLVLDRAASPGGVATQRTTAKVSALQGVTLQKIVDHRGPDIARGYAHAQLEAVTAIRRIVTEVGIDCDLVDAAAVTFATESKAARLVEREREAAAAAGLDVHDGSPAVPFPTTATVVLDDQLHLHPGKLCRGLVEHLGAARVVTGITVTGVDEDADGCTITTADASVRSRHAVIATQGPIVDPWLLTDRCEPAQSYCLIGRLDAPIPAGMHLSCDDLPISLRPVTLEDGSTGLIVGGAGHLVGQPRPGPSPWTQLADWTRANLGPFDVIDQWTTHDLVTTDRVPFIGRLHGRSHRRFVATGFGKWGMTNAQVAARLVADAIEGSPSPDSHVFDATRLRSTINRGYVDRVGSAVKHVVIDRALRRPEPRCTHQGCVLRDDRSDGTWACPCHGSRFAHDGTPLQGPAVKDLRRT